MTPERRGQLKSLGVDPVQGLPHRVEAVNFHHDMDETGRILVGGRADRQAVVAFVDSQEANPYRTELRRRRYAEGTPGAKSQDSGVKLEQPVHVDGGYHHMAQTLITGDKARPERGDDGAVVEHRPVEHLECRTRRIFERDGFIDAPLVSLVQRQLFEGHIGARQCGPDPVQRGVVTYLPADCHQPVNVTGDDDDPGGSLVHPQVQRRRVGTLPFCETQDTKGKFAPA